MSNGKQGPPLEIPDFDKSTGKGSLVSPKQLLSQAKKGVGKAAKAVRHRGKRQNVNPLNLAASQASATSRRHLEDQSVSLWCSTTLGAKYKPASVTLSSRSARGSVQQCCAFWTVTGQASVPC